MLFGRPKGVTVSDFVQIGHTVADIWPFFDFLRWRPSAILDLLYACLDHPQSVFWWSLSLCKMWFESGFSSYDNMQVLIFWALSSKMPIHAHFLGVLGAKIGENRNFVYVYPSRNAIHPETRILRYNLSKSVQRFDPSCAKEATKNKLKSTDP